MVGNVCLCNLMLTLNYVIVTNNKVFNELGNEICNHLYLRIQLNLQGKELVYCNTYYE